MGLSWDLTHYLACRAGDLTSALLFWAVLTYRLYPRELGSCGSGCCGQVELQLSSRRAAFVFAFSGSQLGYQKAYDRMLLHLCK